MDLHALQIVWFVLIAILWTGYLVLEGFDFGVGMLLPFLGRTDTERRVLINTIGPVWDGNEVWLLTAGGATFAAFPLWYAVLFSGFYVPLLLILAALIVRGVAFEYRGKVDDVRWRARWDLAIVVGSWVPALLWGVAFGNLLHGVDRRHYEAGPFAVLLHALNPYSLLFGVLTVTVFALHGALFLALRTTGDLRDRALSTARTLAVPAAVVGAVWALCTQGGYGKAWTWSVVLVAGAALIGIVGAVRAGREALGFALSSLATVAAVVLLFGAMYPTVLPIHGGESLTITNASSTRTTLTVMTWVAVLVTPVVLAYQAWTYWVFRARLGLGDIPASVAPKRLRDAPDPAPAP